MTAADQCQTLAAALALLAAVVLWLLSRRHATRAEYAAEHAEEAARVAVRAAQFVGNVNAVWKG